MIPGKARKMHYEEVPSDPGAAFTFREFEWSSFPFNWHFHPEVELTLIVRGRGMRFVGDSVEEFADGDICLLGANTPHCWVSHKDAELGVRSLVIQFRPESWGDAFWTLPELRGIRRLLKEASHGFEVRGAARAEVEQLFHVLEQQPAGSLQRIETFVEMLQCISQTSEKRQLSASTMAPDGRDAGNQKLGKILGYIHAHLGPELTQREVAEAVQLSPAAFSQFFRRSFGTSYVAYVNELKVRKACRALLDTDSPVTEIAFEAGFNNLSHFNAQFLRFRHVSPRTFRLQARRVEAAGGAQQADAAPEVTTRDRTVHGKGTTFDGVRSGTEEPRPWLKRYAVCPALVRYHMLHAGIAEAHAPYQIVRQHQSTSYFLACFGGRGRVLVDGRWRIIRSGVACLLPAHVHNVFEALPAQPWQFAYVCYGEQMQSRLTSGSTPVVTEFNAEPLRRAIQGLAAECRGGSRPAHVEQWLKLLQSYFEGFALKDDPIRALWARVAARLHEPWSSATLSREAGCSWETLRRLCQRELGRGPLQHLTHLRMRRATELLTGTELHVRAIAQALGYSKPWLFSKAFRLSVGCLPAEYRQAGVTRGSTQEGGARM